MSRTDGRVGSTPESGVPESTGPPPSPPSPPSPASPPSGGQLTRNPHWTPPSPPSGRIPPPSGRPPPLTPLLQAAAPTMAVTVAAVATHHRPALRMSVVVRP